VWWNKGKWKEVWDEIKNISQAFRGSRFPTVQSRQAAWDHFQTIIAEQSMRH
jgi:hypothetical protein